MTQCKAPVITIDGASGTGKGTVSQSLAKQLGWNFLDSGALYRVLALAAKKHRVALNNAAALIVLAEYLDVQFTMQQGQLEVILEGERVTEVIRTENIGHAASMVAVLPVVRVALLSRQRAFRVFPGLVADGRDMGTVVFPDALLKVFLLAGMKERALRRFNQLKGQNLNVNLNELVTDLKVRDERDHEREIAPLRPAEEAICIYTDHLSVAQVVNKILTEFNVNVSQEGNEYNESS